MEPPALFFYRKVPLFYEYNSGFNTPMYGRFRYSSSKSNP